MINEEVFKKCGLFWQYPVITEKEFYNQNKNDIKYLAFPWATVIDKNISLDEIYKFIISQYDKCDFTYSCCQHIYFRRIIPLLKKLGIKVLYAPHKIKNEDEIDGIYIKPCPLYAVNVEDKTKNKQFSNVDYINVKRPLLYSFQGAWNPRLYISDIRNTIFEMKHPYNAVVKNTLQWHFENVVYSEKQNKYNEYNSNELHDKNTNDYNLLLLHSKYSLCPSGTGPNSIRFWESLAVGCIPILLADTLELPDHELWDSSIVIVKENDIFNLNNILKNIDNEDERRKNCIKLYNHFRNNYKNEENMMNEKQIVVYFCGSYDILDFGGVAAYDRHIKLCYPNRKFFKGPQQKNELLSYINNYKKEDVIIITDNHLSCDIPNEYNVILVHHGCALTTAERNPDWDPYWKNLCTEGQKQMLSYRNPATTIIMSISESCTYDFTKYFGDEYTKFNIIKLLNTSEFDTTLLKDNSLKIENRKPIIIGNFENVKKGKEIVNNLPRDKYDIRQLNVKASSPDEESIQKYNKEKQNQYLEADVFLQISNSEGNSFATNDALACGLPVVATNVGLFYDDPPEDSFVKIELEQRNNIDYVMNRIDYALENKELIGKNGFNWWNNNCNFSLWKDSLHKIVTLFQ